MSFMINGVRFIDNALLNIGPSVKALDDATKKKDDLGAIQATVEFGKGTADTTNYAILGLTKAVAFASVFTDASEKVTNVVNNILAVDVLGGLGVVIGSLTVIIQSIAIHRQGQVLATIPEKARLSADPRLVHSTIDDLEKININHLKKSLPTLMREKIEKDNDNDGATFFRDLKEKARTDDTQAAQQTLNEIRDYAFKKRVVHILTLIGGIITLAAGIGLLISFPPMILLVLSAASIALTITCVVLNKGWVENTKEGFDWKLLLPQSLRDKLKSEVKEPNGQMELVPIHDQILRKAQVATASELAALKTLRVSHDMTPVVQKKSSFLDKFLGLFGANRIGSFFEMKDLS